MTKWELSTISGQNILVIGIGGGCDIISAIALGKALQLPSNTRYANTKSMRSSMKKLRSVPNTRYTFLTPEPKELPKHKRWRNPMLEECLPRIHEHPYLVVQCPQDVTDRNIAAKDLQKIVEEWKIDQIFAVDTGGDVLSEETESGAEGRDRRMLGMVKTCGVPVTLFVVGPGSDGESEPEVLTKALEREKNLENYMGKFVSVDLVDDFRELGSWVGTNRTPNIILDAHNSKKSEIKIKRGRKPIIATTWLKEVWVFRVCA